MANPETFQCPVCNARFRSVRTCSRCGADLSILMTLLSRARACRERAREALHACDFKKALSLARRPSGNKQQSRAGVSFCLSMGPGFMTGCELRPLSMICF